MTENTQLTRFGPYRNLNLSEQRSFAPLAPFESADAVAPTPARVSARLKRGKLAFVAMWLLVIALVVVLLAVVGMGVADEYIDLFLWTAGSCAGLCAVTALGLMFGPAALKT